MPIYEYRCSNCETVFEEMQRGFDEQTPACPTCANLAQRQISHTAFILKGSGWYATDYCGNRRTPADCQSASAKCSTAPACGAGGGCAASSGTAT